jgi:hypothetical protein
MSLVGKHIDAVCPRCGLILAHIVLYEVAGGVGGVKCKTCGSEHRYRGLRPEQRRAAAPVRHVAAAHPKTPVRPADLRQWELKDAAVEPDAVVWPYRPEERYEKGDLVDHPHFGRGFVEKITAGRIEVLFREGRKLLAMNRAPAAGKLLEQPPTGG